MKLKVFLLLLILGLSLSFVPKGVVYADSSDILEKQKEIDQYIFEEKSVEIASVGITVTHTSPLEKVVEIGITPYTEENANYFYEVFGKENAIVVEGTQAVTLATGVGATESAQTDVTIDSNSSETEPASSNMLWGAIIIIIITGGAVFVIRNKKVRV